MTQKVIVENQPLDAVRAISGNSRASAESYLRAQLDHLRSVQGDDAPRSFKDLITGKSNDSSRKSYNEGTTKKNTAPKQSAAETS